jgi:hypothetical protein
MNASAEGSLYELVARGNKDVFFYGDQVDSTYIFDNTYQAQTPFLEEVRRVPPKTSSEFGRTVEFDIDVVGDFMKNPAILINLPSWLPESQAKFVKQSTITDASGLSYGYINGIAYFLFENISFYQDNILLQEFSGDALWAMGKISGSYGQGFVHTNETGGHSGTSLEIGWNAAPAQLRLELPILGCQTVTDNGFPQRAAIRHSYRLRCKLRRLEDLVESSDPTTLKKAEPWNKVMTIKRSASDSGLQFTTLHRSSLKPLKLEFETTQVYMDKDVQNKMEEMPLSVRFNRIYTNHFTQNQLDYAGVNGGGISVINRRLDGRHPSYRILWFFRAADDVNANRLYKINTVNNTSYYNSLTFLIAGQTRESPRAATIWRDVTNFAKEETDSGLEINTMNWSFGSIAPKRFSDELTPGSVNFSTADKPTLYIDLARPGSLTTTPSTELFVIVEGLCEFKTDGKGRAELLSMN